MKGIPITFLVIIALLEFLIDFSVGFTVGFYILLFTAILIIYSKLDDYQDLDKFTLVLAIVPLIRLVELLINLEFFWKSLVLYSILLFLGIYYAIRFKVDLGFDLKSLWMLPLVIVIGGLLGILGSFFIDFEQGRHFLYILPLAVISEELLFRGLLQNLGNRAFGRAFSIIFVTLLSAILVGNLGFMFFILFFVVSLFSSIIYDSYKNILLPILLGLIVNSLVYFL